MVRNPYHIHPLVNEMIRTLRDAKADEYYLKGLAGSSKSAVAHAVMSFLKGSHLLIFSDKEDAAYFYTDLVTFEGTSERTLFFPSSYKRSIQYKQTDEANIITRTQTLKRLSEKRVASFIVTYAEALVETVISKKNLEESTLEIRKGEKIDRAFLEEALKTYRFNPVDFVYEPGQYAVRGGIVDIFSYASNLPFRIDFFGEEVDSIRSFDLDTQRSLEPLKKINIIPNIQWEENRTEQRISFFEFIPQGTLLWTEQPEIIKELVQNLFDKTDLGDPGNASDKVLFLRDGEQIGMQMKQFRKIILDPAGKFEERRSWIFNTSSQPPFHKNFDLLTAHLKKNSEEGYTNYILSGNLRQIERLEAIFTETDPSLAYKTIPDTIHSGFIDHDLKLSVYTDHQIFERYHKFRFQNRFSRKESVSVKEILGLNNGDYVVHVDHGIGIFGGLEKIDVNGKVQEAVRLVYKDKDVLFVNIHSLHRISKYKGRDGDPPRIYKLGSGAWQNLKQKTKKRVKDIARDLITLYARRRELEGFAFSPDTYLQKELESSFIYEDTPDQLKATNDIKSGMEGAYPMDRLVCGDVGFGKTEVAIRAAFKAVTDSKQVALLVPTTILAFQHYNTFRERLENFPCTVDYLSRFRSYAEQQKIIKKLAKGEIDIIIGTHRMVGKDIVFKDLGLLIIDEEQKFGVAVKEKLKNIKLNVDTLTLTATPIPRTLQFSLMGARDLSIINTPPPNRHPIITELHIFNEDIIREAIEYEVSRGGQVFFIHNRIDTIGEIKAITDRVLPGIRSVIAHGQMEGKKLERIMLDFINGDYDVLIATSIVESGLDIPNTNTIIINNAHHFGLSDLHQLRGRVGRSNKKAFCYLFAPPVELLPADSRRKLKAIEEFSELGSGFNIAMQDLDIRGAGNLLGAEQSGFISDIGFETYNRILNEALQELRETEFKDLYMQSRPETPKPEDSFMISDCHIDTDLELLLPDAYISSTTERIHLYRRLDEINGPEELQQFREMLTDRFGPLPHQAEELLHVVELRRVAKKAAVEKIVLKKNTMITYFVSDPESPFYRSELFQRIIGNIQNNPDQFRIREEKDKLSLKIDRVNSVFEAYGILEKLLL
ncbi:MAG: transcription-repair coupling factor [Bacteroidales bacterium]|nr:transcription-repair coupling factor [Bacteroidales bacterium]MBN2699733.1 transcription-repair coupling factor [Bacteroidales bacterium]